MGCVKAGILLVEASVNLCYDHCNMFETSGHFIVNINLEVILMSEKWEV